METRIRSSGKNNLKKFKSYYVVWKLDDSEIPREDNEEFKSYYVVWKQVPNKVSEYDYYGLNRTM